MDDDLDRDLEDVRLEIQKLLSERRFYARRLFRVDDALAALRKEGEDVEVQMSNKVVSAYQFARKA